VNHLAYSPVRGRAPRLVAGAASALLLGALALGGCTAGVRQSGVGTGGSGGTTGTGGSGASGGTTGTGGHTTGTGGGGGDIVIQTDAGPSDAAGCQTADVMFNPTNPTVFILVDLSGSEFDTATTGIFFNLRPAVEQVVMSLQDQVRFGIGSFVGDHATGSCKLDYSQVAPALDNYQAIKTAYDSWGPLQPYGSKADTPMYAAIEMVNATLKADTDTGPKYMMLVTDSETDFCDDGNALCPADAITYLAQSMYAQTPSIGTLVVGLPSGLTQISTAVLQNLANAGVGQPIAIPAGSGASTTTDFWYQCNGSMTTGAAWMSLYSQAGLTGMRALANYSAAAGTATAFTPSDTSTAALVTQISAAINTIPRSCVFQLPTFTIDTTKLNEAQVYLLDKSGNKNVVSLDSSKTNGWYMDNITTNSQGMMTSTTLELFGDACTQLRSQNTVDIKFNFPCDLVITIDKP